MSTDLVEADKRELSGPDKINELYAFLLKDWGAMDELIEGTRKKLHARRIRIGYRLIEIQQRIEAGENGDLCTFWEWFADMVPRSRSDAEKMMAIARQDDPEAAYQQRLEKQKEYNERHWRKKLGAPSLEPTSPPSLEPTQTEAEPELLPPAPKPTKHHPSAETDDAILDQIKSLFLRLSWDGCVRGIKIICQIYKEWQAGGR